MSARDVGRIVAWGLILAVLGGALLLMRFQRAASDERISRLTDLARKEAGEVERWRRQRERIVADHPALETNGPVGPLKAEREHGDRLQEIRGELEVAIERRGRLAHRWRVFWTTMLPLAVAGLVVYSAILIRRFRQRRGGRQHLPERGASANSG